MINMTMIKQRDRKLTENFMILSARNLFLNLLILTSILMGKILGNQYFHLKVILSPIGGNFLH